MTHAHHAGYLALVVMWQVMMTAMMAPVVWPWVHAYSRLDSRPLGRVGFSGGYFVAWLGYSAAAAALQFAWLRAAPVAPPALGAAILAGGGLYQFAPLKRACLTHCRNPLTWFLARWHGGPAGGFRLGLGHGAYCVGCCWALMLTALALGVMSLGWMAVLAAVAFVEQVVPRGDLVRVPLGAALVSGGLLRWLA